MKLSVMQVTGALVFGMLPSAAAAAPHHPVSPASHRLVPLMEPNLAATQVTLAIKGFSGSHFNANLGDNVPLVAKVGQVTGGEHLAIEDVTGKARTIQTCAHTKCSRTTHFGKSGIHKFEAFLTGPSGVIAHSKAVTISWVNLTLAFKPSDANGSFNAASNTQLAGVAVKLTATTPSGAVGSLWGQIEIVDDTGAVKAKCRAQSGCSFDALEYAGTRTSPIQPVTHSYRAMALGSSGNSLTQSSPLSITWRPWVVTLSGGGLLAKTDHGSLTVHVERPVTAPNLTLVVVDLNDPAGAQPCSPSGCTLDIGPKTGKHVYQALVVNPATTDVAGASSTAAFQWCPSGMHGGVCDGLSLELATDHDQVPVGGTATLTATSQDDLSGSGDRIVISNGGGGVSDCAVEASTCVWKVKETSPVTRQFTASIEQADGTKAGGDSNTVEVQWKQYAIVSLLPASQQVTAGKPATLTAESNLALLPGYNMKLFEDNGNASGACSNEGGSCTWEATENAPGKHTFHAEIFDDQGGSRRPGR